MAVTDSAYPFNINGQVVLIPGTDGGKQLNSDEARALYKKTGRHLGVFDSVESAKAYFDSAHGQPLAAPTPATSPPGTPPGIPGLGMPKGSLNAPGGHTFGKPPEKAKTPEQKTSEYERLLDDVTNARFDVLPDEQKQKVLKALSASQAEVHPEIGGWPMTKDGKGKWKYILPADLTDTEAKKLGLQIQRAEIASSNAAARAANTQAAAAARTAKAEEQSLKQDEIRKTQDQIQSLRENQEALRYAKFSPNIRRFFNKLSPDEQKRSRELGRQIDQARSHLNKLLTHEAVTSSNQDQKTDQLLRQKGQ
jgi:translation initiation factor 2 beta subunit (eIF-2beta)/eIF-5